MGANASPLSHGSSGTRPVMPTSTSRSTSRWNTLAREPTSSEITSSGWRSANTLISSGTKCSPAVATADTRRVRRASSTASRAARAP